MGTYYVFSKMVCGGWWKKSHNEEANLHGSIFLRTSPLTHITPVRLIVGAYADYST